MIDDSSGDAPVLAHRLSRTLVVATGDMCRVQN